jgi:soluble lytic murein transglycosylase
MIRRLHALPLLLASAAIVLTAAGAIAKQKHGSADAGGKRSTHGSAGTTAKPSKHTAGGHAKHSKHAGTDKKESAEAGGKHSKHDHTSRSKSDDHCKAVVPVSDAAASPAIEALELIAPEEIEAVKQALDLVRKHKPTEATEVEKTIHDPAAKKLVEWAILRSDDMGPEFGRYAAFIRDNPGWPGITFFRRRAEVALWPERRDAATVRRFLAGNPASARGRLALARVLIADGDREGAERLIGETWRNDELSERVESEVLDAFRDFLTASDHRWRMDRRIAAKDFSGAMRAAHRLGGGETAIVKACTAVAEKSGKANKLLDAVDGDARGDLGYTLCRVHWLLGSKNVGEAARVVLASTREGMEFQDTDEWWRERRILARKLLDQGDAKTAYEVVRNGALPANINYRAEFHFMAGWIALRFLGDPAAAIDHFAHVGDDSANPIVLARADYWRGRAAEAAGQMQNARAYYEGASRHSTAYYGQLARARLGLGEIALRVSPELDPAQRAAVWGSDVVRAAAILYAAGERELVISFATDLAERSGDVDSLMALAELAARHEDARTTLNIGKTALARGFALDLYAFPNFGVPRYSPIGPAVDPSITFSVVRTESSFDPQDKSPANAVGLMQVTPESARDTAGRFHATYDWKRMVCDPTYNMQMGAGELAGLLRDYRGSFMMTFAGYNAGRGRVAEWVKAHGDPRDPKIDPVDWVERIPLAETRNYVQRVMENLQVYRVRLRIGQSAAESDLNHAAAAGEMGGPPP